MVRKPTAAESTTITFRCPPELYDYVVRKAGGVESRRADVIRDCVKFEREMDKRLTKDTPRLERVADELSLKLQEDWAEVIAKLVREALDARDELYRQPR